MGKVHQTIYWSSNTWTEFWTDLDEFTETSSELQGFTLTEAIVSGFSKVFCS